jgi:hypothetical protein
MFAVDVCWGRMLAGRSCVETTGTLEPLRTLTGLVFVEMSENSIGGMSEHV